MAGLGSDISIGYDGPGGANSFFTAQFVGTPTGLDQYDQSWNSSSNTTSFDGQGITSIKLKYNQPSTDTSRNFRRIHKVEILIDGKLWRTLTFWGGDWFWHSCNYAVLQSPRIGGIGNNEIELGLYGDKGYLSTDNPYENSRVALNSTPNFTNFGNKGVYLKVYYTETGSAPGHDITVSESSWLTESVFVGNVPVKAPTAASLELAGGKRSFYYGETFDYSTLVVTATFEYQVSGEIAYTTQTANYSITETAAQGIIDAAQFASVAAGTVTVSVGSASAQYTITAYGIRSYTKPSLTRVSVSGLSIGDTDFVKGETAYQVENSTITYGDGTTESVPVTASNAPNGVFVGQGNATLSVVATKTGQTLSWQSAYRVSPLSSIAINADSVDKNFDMDESYSYAGLVVNAIYGYVSNDQFNQVGIKSVSVDDANLSVTFPEKAVGPNKQAEVSYTDGGITKTATYSINVNGLSAMDVDISYYGDHLRVAKNGTLAYGNAVVKVRRYENGELTNWTTNVPPVSVGVLDTSTAGEKTVDFSVAEDGVTLSKSVPVTVYEISSISVSNYPKDPMYYEGANYPTVDVSKFRVIATTSDGEEIALSYNAVSNGYEVLIDGVLQSNDVITVSQDTTLVVRSKTEQSKTKSVSLISRELGAESGAPLLVSGNAVFVSVGEQIDLSGFVVMQKMNNGEYVRISDYSCVIYGKSGLKFGSSDVIGEYYDLVFSKSPSASFTFENGAFLDGVQSVSNVQVSKEIYEIGDDFQTNTVTCTVNYYHASSKSGQPFRTGIDSCDPMTFTSTQANTGTGTNAGKVNVPMTLYGKSVTAKVYVRKVASLVRVSVGTIDPNYNIHDSIDSASHNFKFQKTYNYKIDGVDTYDVPDSALAFTFSGGAASGCSANDLVPLTSTANVGVNASYTENGITVSLASGFVIFVKRLKSVSIIDENAVQITKIYLDKGDRLDLTPYRLHVEFNDASVENVSLGNAASATPANGTIIMDKVETAKVGYTFVPGDFMEATYTIHVHYVSGITTNLDTMIDDTYYVGDTVDLSYVTASRTISSTDLLETGYPKSETFDPSFTLNGMNVNGTSYKLVTAANYTISFLDSGITKSAFFVALPVSLSSISVNVTSAFKDFEDYVEGQRLVLSGLSVTKTFNNGSTATVQYNEPEVQIVDGDGEAFSKTKVIDLTDDGVELFAKIEVNGVAKTASIGTLSVAANELESIEILSSSSHKTSFTYGDRFSVQGLLVKANFTNGTGERVILQESMVSGVAVGHVFNPSDDQTFGSVTIGVSYTHGGITETTSYSISITKPVLASASTNASSDAVVTQYNDGDVYSESGLIVTGTFANGWTYQIPSANWSTNAASALNIDQQTGKIGMTGDYGAKTITVSVTNPFDQNQQGVSTTYSVDVMTSGAIVSAILMFDENVDYANYTVGDVFDAKGVYFHVKDVDGVETDAKTFSSNPPKGTILRSSQRIEVTCTYTKGSFTYTTTYKILVSVPNVLSFIETNDYQLAIGTANGDLIDELSREEQTIRFGKTYDSDGNVTGEYYPLFHEDKVQVDGDDSHSKTYGYNVYTGSDAAGDFIGYIDLGVTASDGTLVRQAHVILFEDPLNPMDGQGNIEVTFPHYVQGLADRINKCKFGIVYNNRLFVSGNPEYKSCDWHSGAVNVSQNESYDRNSDLDFTYFSDLDYCFYGTDDTSIVGYDIYRDGDLIAVKQGSRYQATLYRRSYKLIAAQSYDGSEIDASLAEEAFPMFDVNANGGIGGLSHRSIVSFVGETLILTKDGFKAITNKENVYNSAKYSFDVSSYINPKILNEDLESAFAFAFNEKLILKTSRGVYVGYHELRNENGEYEWYFLCDLPADIFFEHDGELYFANDEGGVYKFPNQSNSHLDMDRTFIEEGGALLDIDDANDAIIASNAYADEIQEGRAFHLLTEFNVNGADVRSQVHASLGVFANENYRRNVISTGGTFDDAIYNGYIDPETSEIVIAKRKSDGTLDEAGTLAIQDSFYDQRKVRFDCMEPQSQGSLEFYEDYRLLKVGDNRYGVIDENGNRVPLSEINVMRMCFVVNDLAVAYIQNVQPYGTDGAKSFNLLGDHSQTLDLVYYNNQNGYYSGVVTAENKVQSFYVTAPYSMGSISSVKTIWAWVIANDTNLASYMDVGYIASRKQGGFETIVKSSPASRKLNFDGFDFSKVSFLNDSLPHVYTKYRTLPSVNFIRFVFKNEEDSNIALTAMDVIYTVSGLTKGVK